MANLKFIIAGDKGWTNEKLLGSKVRTILGPGKHTLIVGDRKGAEKMARDLADAENWAYDTVEPMWAKHGSSAMLMRNKTMVDNNRSMNGVIIFSNDIKKSRVSKNLIFHANAAGIPIILISETQSE